MATDTFSIRIEEQLKEDAKAFIKESDFSGDDLIAAGLNALKNPGAETVVDMQARVTTDGLTRSDFVILEGIKGMGITHNDLDLFKRFSDALAIERDRDQVDLLQIFERLGLSSKENLIADQEKLESAILALQSHIKMTKANVIENDYLVLKIAKSYDLTPKDIEAGVKAIADKKKLESVDDNTELAHYFAGDTLDFKFFDQLDIDLSQAVNRYKLSSSSFYVENSTVFVLGNGKTLYVKSVDHKKDEITFGVVGEPAIKLEQTIEETYKNKNAINKIYRIKSKADRDAILLEERKAEALANKKSAAKTAKK